MLPVLPAIQFSRVILLCVVGGAMHRVEAQTVAAGVRTGSHYETRSELDSAIRAAESARRSSEAWLLKNRLEQGDFQEGDKIVLSMQSPRPSLDTLTVRGGRRVEFAGFDGLSLVGVLRSELVESLTRHLSTFIREPVLKATPLLRMAVLGHVARPGYYYVSADATLSDILMVAGGPGPDADLKRTVIKRGASVIWDADDVQTALSDGLSLDRLHMRAGDEMHIDSKRRIAWTAIIPSVTGVSALVIALLRR